METSTARPQEAVERRGKGVRRAGRRLMIFARSAARPVGQAVTVFLFTFVRWFGIPSPFAAALLLARAEKPTPLMLAGAGTSLAVRALWGLELDVWQYVGIAGLWLALRRLRPRPGIETAALGGLSMMPRVFAALAGHVPLDVLLSLAAVPLGMLAAAFFRSAMDGMTSTAHHKIFVAPPIVIDDEVFSAQLDALREAALRGGNAEVVDKLHEIVETYTPDESARQAG